VEKGRKRGTSSIPDADDDHAKGAVLAVRSTETTHIRNLSKRERMNIERG